MRRGRRRAPTPSPGRCGTRVSPLGDSSRDLHADAHAAPGGPGPAPGDHGGDRARIALEHRLDAPVVAVADPAATAAARASRGARDAEEHALDAAVDDHTDARADVLPSGIQGRLAPWPSYDRRTALLVVDVQNDFADPEAACTCRAATRSSTR